MLSPKFCEKRIPKYFTNFATHQIVLEKRIIRNKQKRLVIISQKICTEQLNSFHKSVSDQKKIICPYDPVLKVPKSEMVLSISSQQHKKNK
jgi:hypothetical protein